MARPPPPHHTSISVRFSTLQREVEQGLRVQFSTRREWIGLLIGKAGARISTVQSSTGCTITVDDISENQHCGLNSGDVGGCGGRGGGGGDVGDDRDGGVGAEGLRMSTGRVIISGSDAGSVRKAKELMEFSEARIHITAGQVKGRDSR